MEIIVERAILSKSFTMSRIYIDGEFFSFGLEPYDAGVTAETPVDDISALKKKYGKIAVPVGEYELVYSWSNKYQKMLPLVKDTPGFKGVRIHSGNKVDDTLACLLVGKYYKSGWLSDSRNTMDKLIAYWKGKDFEKSKITYVYAANKINV